MSKETGTIQVQSEMVAVPHFEGYKCIGYVVPKKNQYYLYNGELTLSCIDSFETEWLVYEKITPKRYVFEETSEFRRVRLGDFYIHEKGEVLQWRNNYESSWSYIIVKPLYE